VVIDHGRVIAAGSASELKAQTGGARLEVTLSEPRPAAAEALDPFRTGPVEVSSDGRRLRAPVRSAAGLASTVVRALAFSNPNPSAHIHAWPMQHPVLASLLWSVALIAVFAPLASHLYRRRTTD
jgi:hypothetical protein